MVSVTGYPLSIFFSSTLDHQEDVVICCAVRTPLCKAKRGSFKDRCFGERAMVETPFFAVLGGWSKFSTGAEIG